MTLSWGSCNAGALGKVEYFFIAIAPRFMLAWSGSAWKGPIYGSNRIIWNLNWEETNDLCQIELFEIELFLHLTVSKQMTGV